MTIFQTVALGVTLALVGLVGSLSAQTAPTDQGTSPLVRTIPIDQGIYRFAVSKASYSRPRRVHRLASPKAHKGQRARHLARAQPVRKTQQVRHLASAKPAPKPARTRPLMKTTRKAQAVRPVVSARPVSEAKRVYRPAVSEAAPKNEIDPLTTSTAMPKDKADPSATTTASRDETVPKETTPKEQQSHRIAIQVNQNDPAAMNLALNNAENVIEYYKERGEDAQVEIVAFGPGLNMLRGDTSPVKDRIEQLKNRITSGLSFAACGNTQARMEKSEGKPITILPQAATVPSGVVRLMQLQEQGWSYIRP